MTRVLLDATDGDRSWTTIGVSANIIEASWRALEESIVYGLLHACPRRELAPAGSCQGVRLAEQYIAGMAAPRFAPVSPTDHPRGYDSPPHVPEAWTPSRAR